MMRYEDSYIGRLRGVIGSRPLLVSGVRVVVENEGGDILFQLRGDMAGV
jgi:hypothetical protein